MRPRIGNGRQRDSLHPATIWSGLQRRIEKLHERVRWLAFAVAIFTVALACFTFADATIRLRRRWVKWALFAMESPWPWPLSSSFCSGWTPKVGHCCSLAWSVRRWPDLRCGICSSRPSAGAGSILTPTPVMFTQNHRTGAFRHTGAGSPHDLNDRLTTFVVVALAVTVVLSALSGWGYSWSDTHADQMALHARGHAAEIAKHSYFLGRAQERIGELATNLDCRARFAA